MRHIHSWVGVVALFALAGTASAQPGAFAPLAPAAPPSVLPPTGPPVRSLAELPEEHLPVKDLTPHGGFHDLHPCDDGHHSAHEIPGSLAAVVPSHGGFYTNAEFLLMRPRNTDFDFVLRTPASGLGTQGPIDSFKYSPGTGLRAEVGYVADGGRWDAGFAYTYFTASDQISIFANPNEVLLPTFTRPGLTDRVLSAQGRAGLDYQLFDMLAGRRFALEENVAVRAIAGFRFTDIRQTLDADFDGLDARRAAVRTRSRFQGFGPLIGAEATLAGPKGFHLYTRATGGLLTGNSVNALIETNDNGATTYINTRNDVRKVVPFGSIAIGGGWQYRSFAIRAGYEITHFQGLFERPRFVDDVSPGKVINRAANLSLEGLFLQASVIY